MLFYCSSPTSFGFVSLLPLTISLLGQIMSLLWQLDCARWVRGRGKGGQLRVRTSRVDYVKRVNAHEAGQANFYCQDHTQQQQQRVGNKRGEKTTRNWLMETKKKKEKPFWEIEKPIAFCTLLSFSLLLVLCIDIAGTFCCCYPVVAPLFLLLFPCCYICCCLCLYSCCTTNDVPANSTGQSKWSYVHVAINQADSPPLSPPLSLLFNPFYVCLVIGRVGA